MAGCLAACAVLAVVIASRFAGDPVTDDPLPPNSTQQVDVVAKPDSSAPASSEPGGSEDQGGDVTVTPETPAASTNTNTGDGADSTGTEQSIQADPAVPETPDEEVLTDPSQKPDGTPVEDAPTSEDHDTYEPPIPPSTNTSGGLPGFGNVPDAGENQGEILEDMYENGNKIGIMD